MEKKETLAKLKEIGLIAVLRGPSPELTVKMVQALIAGGVDVTADNFTAQ